MQHDNYPDESCCKRKLNVELLINKNRFIVPTPRWNLMILVCARQSVEIIATTFPLCILLHFFYSAYAITFYSSYLNIRRAIIPRSVQVKSGARIRPQCPAGRLSISGLQRGRTYRRVVSAGHNAARHAGHQRDCVLGPDSDAQESAHSDKGLGHQGVDRSGYES